MSRYFERIKAELAETSPESIMITVVRKDLDGLTSEYERAREPKMTSRSVALYPSEESICYCMKVEQDYVFSLPDYSWSLKVKNAGQVERLMEYENGLLGQTPLKQELINHMKTMIDELDSVQKNKTKECFK